MSYQSRQPVPQNLTLDNQLCFAVHSASNAIDKLYRPRLGAHDLTYSQYIALMALAEEDGISISALAQRMGVSKATMTPLLRRLDEKGLISRQMEDGNERQKNVSLTDAGRQTLEGSCYVTEKVFAKTGLSLEEAEQLISLCKKVVQSNK